MVSVAASKEDRRNTRWEEHRNERRRELIESAITAVKKYGYDTSMDQIAAESKTSKSILYKYFGDKEGLQYAIGQHTINSLIDEIGHKSLSSGGGASGIPWVPSSLNCSTLLMTIQRCTVSNSFPSLKMTRMHSSLLG